MCSMSPSGRGGMQTGVCEQLASQATSVLQINWSHADVAVDLPMASLIERQSL